MQRLSTVSATLPNDYLLAFARARFALARVRRVMERKAGFDPSQPRDDRGRWTSGGGSGSSPSGGQTVATDQTGEESWSSVVSDWNGDGTLAQELVFNRDGSTILSEFAAAGDNAAWDERHTVTVPDGGRFRFDLDGDTQTIADADTGDVLSRATWEKDGPRDEAVPQPVFATGGAVRAIGGAITLYRWLGARSPIDAVPVIGFKADEYTPGEPPSMTPNWVGTRTREEVDDACPRHGEVQSRTDDAARTVRNEGRGLSAQQYGTAVHKVLKRQIKRLDDPALRAEVSFAKTAEESYGAPDSVHIDVLEDAGNQTACIYDIKTGKRGLSLARSLELARTVSMAFPGTRRMILIETRPRS